MSTKNTKASVDIKTGLMLYLPFNGNAEDVSGKESVVGVYDAVLTKDRYGNDNSAYHFNGVNSYMRVSNSKNFALEIGKGDYSLTAWIYPEAQKDQIIFTKTRDHDYCGGIGYALSLTGEKLLSSCTISSSVIKLQSKKCVLNKWSFVSVVVRRDRGVELYLDGHLSASSTTVTSFDISNNDAAFIGGNDKKVGNFFGSIDEIRLYNIALSRAQVTAIMDEGSHDVDITTGLILHIPVESNKQVYDASGINGRSYYIGGSNNGVVLFGSSTKDDLYLVEDRHGNMGHAIGFSGGSNGYMTVGIGSNDPLHLWTSDHSFTVWIYLRNRKSGAILSKKYSSETGTWLDFYIRDGGNLCYSNNYHGERCSSRVIDLNVWTFVSFVKKGAQESFYVNGKLEGSFNDTVRNLSCSSYLRIGLWEQSDGSFGAHFSGYMDDIRVYNVALTVSQINVIMNYKDPTVRGDEAGTGAGIGSGVKLSTNAARNAEPVAYTFSVFGGCRIGLNFTGRISDQEDGFDKMKIRIVEMPKNGVILYPSGNEAGLSKDITELSNLFYEVNKPCDRSLKDSFQYVAVDSQGAESEVAMCKIEVRPSKKCLSNPKQCYLNGPDDDNMDPIARSFSISGGCRVVINFVDQVSDQEDSFQKMKIRITEMPKNGFILSSLGNDVVLGKDIATLSSLFYDVNKPCNKMVADSFQYIVIDSQGARSEVATCKIETRPSKKCLSNPKKCYLNSADDDNMDPVANTFSIFGGCRIGLNFTGRISDQEDGFDKMKIKIVEMPKNGVVLYQSGNEVRLDRDITELSSLFYEVNRPCDKFVKDSFQYVAVDSQGAESEVAICKIDAQPSKKCISNPDVCYRDMVPAKCESTGLAFSCKSGDVMSCAYYMLERGLGLLGAFEAPESCDSQHLAVDSFLAVGVVGAVYLILA